MPKLIDVAKMAGVSIATASLVLSGKGKISDEVKERVLESAANLGYIRKIATSAKIKNTVGVLLHIESKRSYLWYLLRPLIESIQKTCLGRDLKTIIIPVHDEMTDSEIVENVIASKVEGVFSILYGTKQLLKEITRHGIPFVMIINNEFQNDFHTAGVDDFQGAYEGTKHLIKLGHKHIAFADFDIVALPELIGDRFIGFSKAMMEHSLKIHESSKLNMDITSPENILQTITHCFSRKDRPTALFAVDDYLAVKIVWAINEIGLKVPEDVSIIAPGDVMDFSEPFIPNITTMKINMEMLGKYATDLYFEQLDKPEDKTIHVLKVKQHLTDRGSCRAI